VSVNEQWISDFTSETVPFIASQADLALVEEQLAIQQDVNTEATNSDENTKAEKLNRCLSINRHSMLEFRELQWLQVRAKYVFGTRQQKIYV